MTGKYDSGVRIKKEVAPKGNLFKNGMKKVYLTMSFPVTFWLPWVTV